MNLKPLADTSPLKCCKACWEVLPLSHFTLDSKAPDGHRASCNSCRKLQRKGEVPIPPRLRPPVPDLPDVRPYVEATHVGRQLSLREHLAQRSQLPGMAPKKQAPRNPRLKVVRTSPPTSSDESSGENSPKQVSPAKSPSLPKTPSPEVKVGEGWSMEYPTDRKFRLPLPDSCKADIEAWHTFNMKLEAKNPNVKTFGPNTYIDFSKVSKVVGNIKPSDMLETTLKEKAKHDPDSEAFAALNNLEDEIRCAIDVQTMLDVPDKMYSMALASMYWNVYANFAHIVHNKYADLGEMMWVRVCPAKSLENLI